MESTYTVSEETWNFEVCVDSGVTGGFQTDLSISLTAVDGKASKLDNLEPFHVFILGITSAQLYLKIQA